MATAEAPPVGVVAATVRGYGGGAGAGVQRVRPADVDQARDVVVWSTPDRCAGRIGRGLGRSYGDAAQLTGGLVLEMTGLRDFELDADAGTVTAFAGATIGQLLAVLLDAGWTLPVVPGTQHVTVGGAVASDVHGKNHPSAGSFGAHVVALGLLTATGETRELRPGEELFAATLGGMGLTGLVLWARIRLERVDNQYMAVDTERVPDLDGALAGLDATAGAPHRVAWLDLLGPRPGRGILTGSAHLAGPAPGAGARAPSALTVPEHWPGGLLRARTVRAFNELRFRRAPRRERGRPVLLRAHMFPLDSLVAWPRLYGPAGLLQYQFAVPRGQERTLEAIVAGLARARVPCFLATLKALGRAPGGPLSFPLPGWTLALDIPRAAPGVDRLLDGFDDLVAAAGGRVYLTKDARLGPGALGAMYPRLAQWRAVRDAADPQRTWGSDLALRTGLISGGDP